jgi:coenzyme Q-binding protein COQ10
MLSHIEQKTLSYTPQQMFDLVADVARYKEFLPWCVGSRINSRDSDDVFYADLIVGYKMIRERFSSKVVLENSNHITIEYLRGPLKHLTNHWRFSEAEDGGCVIDFSVEFEFQNKMLQGLAQVFFQEVITRMVGAFEARAHDVYGAPE